MDLPTVVASYLIGSISFPWLIAWWYRIDLRTAGARKLGGSDLARVLGMRWGIAGGGLDAAKGALVVLIASALGLPDETRALCAIAAVAGQMWPVFHDLDGGRANATGWGALLGLDVIAAAIAAIPLAAAVAARYAVKPPPRRVTPIAALLTFLVWPAAIWETSGVTPLVVGGLIIFVLIAARRLTAGLDADIRTGAPLGRILLDRLLFDRSALQESGALPI
jgi:glycerol-3-phosphate acyltransferase PlsY